MAFFFILSYGSPAKAIKDPKPKRFPFVSIIIPAYNEEKAIVRTIKCVCNLVYPKNKYEIIVVDDGSSDKTFSLAKRFEKQKEPIVRVFKKVNGGVASAKNYGIKKAKGELIATLDADSFVSRNALKNMIGYLEDPKVIAVAPSLNVYKPKGFLQNLQWAEYMMGIFLRKVFSQINAIHVIPGPFSIYKKSFFEKHGAFNEGNITEDTELAMRAQTLGYKIKNSMAAAVYTVTPNSFKSLLIQRIRWYYGFIQNSIQYKRLLNPKKYGDLAVMILPSAFISIAFAIASLVIIFHSFFLNIQGNITRFSALGFDAFKMLFNITGSYIKEGVVSYFTNPFMFFIVIGILITVLWIIRARQGAKDKRSMKFAFVCFFLTYGVFYAFWWLATFIYRGILRKKIKWGPRLY